MDKQDLETEHKANEGNIAVEKLRRDDVINRLKEELEIFRVQITSLENIKAKKDFATLEEEAESFFQFNIKEEIGKGTGNVEGIFSSTNGIIVYDFVYIAQIAEHVER